jgi:malonyl-CoA/methylmalonyl-CoA synthetase
MTDRFDPEAVLNILQVAEGPYACTIFMAVPPMYVKLMDHIGDNRFDFSHMRLLTSGSAPLLVKDFQRIKNVFGKEPVEREGMTETGMNFSNPIQGVRKPGSIGLPFPGLQVKVVDPETFSDVPEGEKGEFWLKSFSITPGYWRKPEETAKAFKEGWFRTGDLGKVDADGYYYLTDRLKHIIISGGENISPKEIEGAINQLDDVVESSVVGIADEQWGEKVVAVVVVLENSPLSPEKIRQHCKEHLHAWKCPKVIRIVDRLPRNTMGKVLKESVKEMFE